MLGLGVGFYKLAGDAGTPYLIRKGGGSGSMVFDGADQSVQINNMANDIEGGTHTGIEFSASAWIKIGGTSATGTVFNARYDANNQFNIIYHHATSQLRATIKANGTLKQPVYDASELRGDDNWHHVAMTTSSTSGKIILYVDGDAQAEASGLDSMAFGSNDINVASIGQNTQDGAFWIGSLDEVALWNRALSSANITTLYNNGAQSGEKTIDLSSTANGLPLPIAWYRFENDQSTTAINSADYTQHGTYVNAPTNSTSTP